MPRRKNEIEGISTSDSSPEFNNTPKMPNNRMEQNSGPVTQAWLSSMFEKHSAQISTNVEKRITESEEKIKEHLNGKIEALNQQISQLQEDKERQEERIESLEKMLKLKNIVISGPNVNKIEIKEIIDRCLASAGEGPSQLIDIRQITARNGTVKHIATCNSVEEKTKISRSRKEMSHNGQKIFINSDLTRSEQEIQYEARKFAKQQERGAKVSVAYKKVWVNDKSFTYDKSTKSFKNSKN